MDEQDVFKEVNGRYPHEENIIVSLFISKQFGCQYGINVSPDLVVVGKTWVQAMDRLAMEEERRRSA